MTTDGYTYPTVGASTIALNVNARSFSVGSISDAAFKRSNIFSHNVSSLGRFNMTINNEGGFASAVSSVSFDLTAGDGTSWSSASNVLSANSRGSPALRWAW